MNSLQGKVALISGAARGIGGETAQLMAKAGAKVVIGDVLDDRGRQTVAAINAAGGQADHHIIQRVGRGLRTADDKEILDYHDFMFHNNEYLLEHSKKRVKILRGEGHDVTVLD